MTNSNPGPDVLKNTPDVCLCVPIPKSKQNGKMEDRLWCDDAPLGTLSPFYLPFSGKCTCPSGNLKKKKRICWISIVCKAYPRDRDVNSVEKNL